MFTITPSVALELLEAVVAEAGEDHVYGVATPVCLYAEYPLDEYDEYGGMVDRDAPPVGPGCIVGHALHMAGLPLEALAQMDNYGSITEADHREWLVAHGIDLTPEAQQVFYAAQLYQDRGCTWGHALDNARTAL